MPARWLDAIFPDASKRFGQYGARGTPSQRLYRLARVAREPDWFHFYRGIVSRWTEHDRLVRSGSDTGHMLADPPAWMRALPQPEYMMLADTQTYLSDDILAKVDRASMANSLEVRAPILDHKLMELVARIPSRLKLRGSEGKYIFKRALASYLPENILHRKKMGFAAPISSWFRKELKEMASAAIFDPPDDGLLDRRTVQNLWSEHQRGRRDRSTELWVVLMFRLWQRQFQSAAKPALPS